MFAVNDCLLSQILNPPLIRKMPGKVTQIKAHNNTGRGKLISLPVLFYN